MSAFVSLNPTDAWGWMTLLCGASSALWGVEEHPWSLPIRSRSTPCQVVTREMSLDIVICPLRAKSFLVENHR